MDRVVKNRRRNFCKQGIVVDMAKTDRGCYALDRKKVRRKEQ